MFHVALLANHSSVSYSYDAFYKLSAGVDGFFFFSTSARFRVALGRCRFFIILYRAMKSTSF